MKIRHYFLLHKFIFVILVFVILVFSGCFSVKPGSTKSGKKYFETFFVGEMGSQYFIKPILFVAEDKDEKLFADFTFRYRKTIEGDVVINFSIESQKIYKTIDSLTISNSNKTISTENVTLLFNETTKNRYRSRFSVECTLEELVEIFATSYFEFSINMNGESITYRPTSKTQKILSSLQRNIFVIIS